MYPLIIREAALKMYSFFKSLRKTSQILDISISSISRWTKSLLPKQRKHTCTKTSEALKIYIKLLLCKTPCITCTQICQNVSEGMNTCISRQLVSNIIKTIGFSFKKVQTRGTSSKKQMRTEQFIESYKAIPKTTTIVSIDESGFDLRAHSMYGYAEIGKQVIVTNKPSKDRKKKNLLLAISNKGHKCFLIVDVNVNAIIFNDFINALPYKPGTVLLMDNHKIHQKDFVTETIRNKGYTVLFTPPYSPEFNPIELVFGALKTKYYKLRCQEQPIHVTNTVFSITSNVTVKHIRNCFNHVEKDYIYTN